MVFTLILPLSVPLSPKTKFILNLNHYRNTHYQTLNRAKVIFEKMMTEQVSALPIMQKVQLEYVVYPKTLRKFDVANICSIADKFLSDVLVNLGKLPDDDHRIIDPIIYRFGGYNSTNPRIEVNITEVPKHASLPKRNRSTSGG